MKIPSFCRCSLVAACFVVLSNYLAAAPESPGLTLWYASPATRWIDALALGNGRLGAMVFGGTAEERIGLNEDTLWSGGPYEPSTEVAPEVRAGILRLMFDGKFRDAQNLASKLQGTPNSQSSYQTIGDGNFGSTAGITEMLLQSHIHAADVTVSDLKFEINLLPALP